MIAPREIPPPAPRTRLALTLWAAQAAEPFAARGEVICASIAHDDGCGMLRGEDRCCCRPTLRLERLTDAEGATPR